MTESGAATPFCTVENEGGHDYKPVKTTLLCVFKLNYLYVGCREDSGRNRRTEDRENFLYT